MKKVVVFVHGDYYSDFSPKNSLHKDYEKKMGEKIFWRYIFGHLGPKEKNFSYILRELENADIFLCDADNTNLRGELANPNFDEICHQNLLDALEIISKKYPNLKIYIVDFFYIGDKQRKKLSDYGKLINDWTMAT